MADTTKHAVIATLGKKGSGKKMHTHAMHIRRAHGGGYIAKHEMHDAQGQPGPDQEHVIPDADALQDHVQTSMGDQPPAQPMMAQGGAPDPAQGGGAPAPDPGAMG